MSEPREFKGYMLSIAGSDDFCVFVNEYPDGGFKWSFLDYKPENSEDYREIYITTEPVVGPYLAAISRAEKAEKKLEACKKQRNEEINTNLLLVEWKFRSEAERVVQYEQEVRNCDSELEAAEGKT